MLRILIKRSYRNLLFGLALLFAGSALILFPAQSMDAGREGLQLCTNVIIPSLFPFFVLSSLVVELGLAHCLGHALERLMWPLFRIGGPGASALVLGFVGGYPVGARTAIQLYETGLLSRNEVQRLLAFCNNSGPAFILGVVGSGVFGNGTVGLLLYLVHVITSVFVGIIFRFFGTHHVFRPPHTSPSTFQTVRFSTALTNSIKSAFSSVLNICAFVLFFSVALRLLSLCGIMNAAVHLLTAPPFSFRPSTAQQLLTGLVELSSGVTTLIGSVPTGNCISTASFMLGWAGLCVHCQVLSFLADSDLSARSYFFGKALHGLLSAFFTTCLTRFFPFFQPTSGSLPDRLESLALPKPDSMLIIAVVAAWLLWILFLLLSAIILNKVKKGTGKTVTHRV